MKIVHIAIGLIILIAVGMITVSGGGNGSSGNGNKPDEAGIPRLEVENNTIVFIGFSDGSGWNVTISNNTGFSQYDEGTMDLSQRKSFSVMYVVDISSNPTKQIEVDAYGDYDAIIYGIDDYKGITKKLETTLHVLEETDDSH